jgi:hypothetical protein
MFSILEARSFYTSDTGEDFFGISLFISRERNKRCSDFVGLDSFSSCLYFAKTDSTDSTTTSKGDIDAVHGCQLLKMLFILCNKSSEFFSCGVFDNNGNGSCEEG